MHRSRFPLAVFCLGLFSLGLFWSSQAHAGLVLLVDRSINIRTVSDLAIDRGHLVVKLTTGQTRRIELPYGALEPIAVWAASPVDGPMVFSIDGAFTARGENYIPPCVPAQLGSAMLDYDVYAHQMALGSLPENRRNHPLVARKGDTAMPDRQFAILVSNANRSEAALWYRSLASRHTSVLGSPLQSVGEFTLRAVPEANGFPIRIEVESWLTAFSTAWYRDVVVPSAWDHQTAMLPYKPLQADIEQHWPDYRRAFKPMDELSSIVEAYSLLKTVCSHNEPLWKRFRDRLTQGMDVIRTPERVFATGSPDLRAARWGSTDEWLQLCRENVGDRIETSAQANLALALLVEHPEDIERQTQISWRRELDGLAKKNNRLAAKLALADALKADPGSDNLVQSTQRFFDITGRHADLFRLRVQGLHQLTTYHREVVRRRLDSLQLGREWPSLQTWINRARTGSEETIALLGKERNGVLADFRKQVADAMARADVQQPNLFVWENLIQNVYSVDLLKLALAGSADDEQELIRSLATIHYYRGLAPQVGRELAYRHAHFRFLKYLARRAPEDALLRRNVNGWRMELANRMGLTFRGDMDQ